jgi:hypothetical protein
MRTSYYCLAVLALSTAALSGCGKERVPPGLAACREVMELNAKQLGETEEGKEKLLMLCEQGMFERNADDWKCVANLMRQGKKYIPATDECFKK